MRQVRHVPLMALNARIPPTTAATTKQALMPTRSVVIVEDCGHHGWLDQPERYLSTVQAFLTDR